MNLPAMLSILLSGSALVFVMDTSAQPAFPTVDPATQQARDHTRRQILLDELATEQSAMGSAKQALQAATDSHQPIANIAKLRETVERHVADIASLQREIDMSSSLKSGPPARLTARAVAPGPAPAAPFWDVYKRVQAQPPASFDGTE